MPFSSLKLSFEEPINFECILKRYCTFLIQFFLLFAAKIAQIIIFQSSHTKNLVQKLNIKFRKNIIAHLIDSHFLKIQSSLVFLKYPEAIESCLFQVARGSRHCLSCHTNWMHLAPTLLTSAERSSERHVTVKDLYAARYPDRQQKSHMTFKRLADLFRHFGTVKKYESNVDQFLIKIMRLLS